MYFTTINLRYLNYKIDDDVVNSVSDTMWKEAVNKNYLNFEMEYDGQPVTTLDEIRRMLTDIKDRMNGKGNIRKSIFLGRDVRIVFNQTDGWDIMFENEYAKYEQENSY